MTPFSILELQNYNFCENNFSDYNGDGEIDEHDLRNMIARITEYETKSSKGDMIKEGAMDEKNVQEIVKEV